VQGEGKPQGIRLGGCRSGRLCTTRLQGAGLVHRQLLLVLEVPDMLDNAARALVRVKSHERVCAGSRAGIDRN
jgi:hypothetical protein